MDNMGYMMGGPMMDGTWINNSTGDYFTVRDTFFQDDKLLVQTTTGRTYNYDQISSYVRVSDEKTAKSISDSIKASKAAKVQAAKQKKANEIPASILAEIEDLDESDSDGELADEMSLIYGNAPAQQAHKTEPVIHTAPKDINYTIIDKALSKAPLPDIEASIDWPDYPEMQIGMLQGMMDIDIESIISYYIDKVDTTTLVDSVKDAIRKRILGEVTKNDTPKTEETTKMSKAESLAKARAVAAEKRAAKENQNNN